MEELVDKLNLECKHRNSKGVLIPRKWTVDDVNLNDANYLEYAYCTLIDKGYYDDLLCDACRATLTEVFETKSNRNGQPWRQFLPRKTKASLAEANGESGSWPTPGGAIGRWPISPPIGPGSV